MEVCQHRWKEIWIRLPVGASGEMGSGEDPCGRPPCLISTLEEHSPHHVRPQGLSPRPPHPPSPLRIIEVLESISPCVVPSCCHLFLIQVLWRVNLSQH